MSRARVTDRLGRTHRLGQVTASTSGSGAPWMVRGVPLDEESWSSKKGIVRVDVIDPVLIEWYGEDEDTEDAEESGE